MVLHGLSPHSISRESQTSGSLMHIMYRRRVHAEQLRVATIRSGDFLDK